MDIVVAIINGMVRLTIAMFQIMAKLVMFGIHETQRAINRTPPFPRRPPSACTAFSDHSHKNGQTARKALLLW